MYSFVIRNNEYMWDKWDRYICSAGKNQILCLENETENINRNVLEFLQSKTLQDAIIKICKKNETESILPHCSLTRNQMKELIGNTSYFDKSIIETIENSKNKHIIIPVTNPNYSFESIKVDVSRFKTELDYKYEILKKINESREKKDYYWYDCDDDGNNESKSKNKKLIDTDINIKNGNKENIRNYVDSIMPEIKRMVAANNHITNYNKNYFENKEDKDVKKDFEFDCNYCDAEYEINKNKLYPNNINLFGCKKCEQVISIIVDKDYNLIDTLGYYNRRECESLIYLQQKDSFINFDDFHYNLHKDKTETMYSTQKELGIEHITCPVCKTKHLINVEFNYSGCLKCGSILNYEYNENKIITKLKHPDIKVNELSNQEQYDKKFKKLTLQQENEKLLKQVEGALERLDNIESNKRIESNLITVKCLNCNSEILLNKKLIDDGHDYCICQECGEIYRTRIYEKTLLDLYRLDRQDIGRLLIANYNHTNSYSNYNIKFNYEKINGKLELKIKGESKMKKVFKKAIDVNKQALINSSKQQVGQIVLNKSMQMIGSQLPENMQMSLEKYKPIIKLLLANLLMLGVESYPHSSNKLKVLAEATVNVAMQDNMAACHPEMIFDLLIGGVLGMVDSKLLSDACGDVDND